MFLDRDDTVIANRALGPRMAHPGYLYEPALVELLPGAAEGCRLLKRAGFLLVIVTNQSSVARGYCGEAAIHATNARLGALLRRGAGVEIDGCYTCLHSPDGHVAPWNTDHPWRKPRGGMLRQAAADLGIDLGRSWMVGDAERDVLAALDAGIARERTIVVGGGRVEKAGAHVPTLADAAVKILTVRPAAERA